MTWVARRESTDSASLFPALQGPDKSSVTVQLTCTQIDAYGIYEHQVVVYNTCDRSQRLAITARRFVDSNVIRAEDLVSHPSRAIAPLVSRIWPYALSDPRYCG